MTPFDIEAAREAAENIHLPGRTIGTVTRPLLAACDEIEELRQQVRELEADPDRPTVYYFEDDDAAEAEIEKLREQIRNVDLHEHNYDVEIERLETEAEKWGAVAQDAEADNKRLREALLGLKGEETTGVGEWECVKIISYRALNQKIDDILRET